jgi:hypothetical protein
VLPLARRFAVAAAILPALALTACNSGAPQPAGGVSKGEAEALAEAAEMLDETRTLPEGAIPAEAAPEAAATPAAQGRQR